MGTRTRVNWPRSRSRLGRTLEERGEKEDGLKAAWRTRAEGPTSARLRLGKMEVAGSKKRKTGMSWFLKEPPRATDHQSKYLFWYRHAHCSRIHAECWVYRLADSVFVSSEQISCQYLSISCQYRSNISISYHSTCPSLFPHRDLRRRSGSSLRNAWVPHIQNEAMDHSWITCQSFPSVPSLVCTLRTRVPSPERPLPSPRCVRTVRTVRISYIVHENETGKTHCFGDSNCEYQSYNST